MIGTLIALIIALLLHFSSIGQEAMPNLPILGIILIAIATSFLFLPTLVLALAWSPLQNAEHHLTPRISQLFLKDRQMKVIHIVLLLFSLLSYIMAIDTLFLNVFNKNIIISIWIVFLGVSLDVLYHMQRRISAYLDPFHIASMFTHEAQLSIQNDKEEELCDWIDALSEMAIRSMNRSSTSLCIQVNNELQHTMKIFLNSSKSISHSSQKVTEKSEGIDTVSYTLFFLLQRLEMINTKAASQQLEPVCSHMVTVLGKIVIDSAKYDMSMPTYPLHFLGKFAVQAQKRGVSDVGPKAILTLVEVARIILNEIDVTYLELQEPFFSLISQMNDITKEMFREDKTMSIKLLTQPFRDLREMFTSEKMAGQQDTPAILQKIDATLAEYEALESVMKTIPPINLLQ